jgi:hypothetical protein
MAAAALVGGLAGTGSPVAASPSAATRVPMLPLSGSQGEVAGPDLECFDTPGAPLQLELRLSHLDPALMQLGLPAHSAVVRELVQTCVAVDRRGIPRPAAAQAAVPPVDLACYRIDTAPLRESAPLVVEHASPTLALLPGHAAALVRPVELCLPVVRDGVAPPPDVRRLVQSIALECYAVEPGPHPAFAIGLTALDPQLAGAADRQLAVRAERRQICVPVAKNSERIPRDVLGIVQRIGVEKLSAAPRRAAAPATPGARVVLRHLNPLLATLPAVPVVLQQASGLMVPVSRRARPAP